MVFYSWLFTFIFFILVLYGLMLFLSYFYKGMFFGKVVGFECGFNPFSVSGVVFSMPFFLVSLMFLLFDVEIILLCFFPISFLSSLGFMGVWFLIVLIFSATLYEWKMGVLGWFSSYMFLVST